MGGIRQQNRVRSQRATQALPARLPRSLFVIGAMPKYQRTQHAYVTCQTGEACFSGPEL
jgi:hypothetical protein